MISKDNKKLKDDDGDSSSSSSAVNNYILKVVDFGCACTHDLSQKDSMHLPANEFALGCSFLHMVALGNQFELEKMLQQRPNLSVNFRDYDRRTGKATNARTCDVKQKT